VTLPIAFDRLVAVVPELRGLQDMVTSSTGRDHILKRESIVDIAAA
jgi:hypothetical protein